MASNAAQSFAFGQTSEKPGATVADITYLPKCTSSSVGTYGGYSLSEANDFDPRTWDYYKGLLPGAIGGWVVAGICLILAIMFMVWLCALCACGCFGQTRKWSRADRHNHAMAEAYKKDPYADPAHGLKTFSGRHSKGSIALCASSVVLLLATLGLGAWGLYEGLNATKDLSTDVFAVFRTARIKVGNLRQGVIQFFSAITGLQAALFALATLLNGVDLNELQQQIDSPLNLTGLVAGNVVDAMNSAADALGSVAATGDEISFNIQRYGVRTLLDILKQQGTFDNVQNIWVPLFLGIMFGVLALVAMVTTVLLILRHVRSGSAFLFLLWIWTALWFFTGPGLLKFGTDLTADVCVYPEHFAFTVVNESNIANDTKRNVTMGLQYYFGAFGPNVTLDDVINEIYGLDITSISTIANSSVVNETINYFVTEAVQTILQANSKLNSTQQQALNGSPTELSNLLAGYNSLQRQMSRSNFDDLYSSAKTLLCCTLANRVRHAWIAWTCAAALTVVLCVVLTLRALQASRWYTRAPHPDQFLVGAGSHGMPPPMAAPIWVANSHGNGSSSGHPQQGLRENTTPSHASGHSPHPSWGHNDRFSEIELAPHSDSGSFIRHDSHGTSNGNGAHYPPWPMTERQ